MSESQKSESQAFLQAFKVVETCSQSRWGGRDLVKLLDSLEAVVRIFLSARQDVVGEYFQFLCEKNLPRVVLGLLQRRREPEVAARVLQLYAMIVYNKRNSMMILSYFLSHLDFQETLNLPFDFANEDVGSNYCQLLKSIALLFSTNEVWKLFCQGRAGMPLLLYALKFYNSPDSLARTTGRNVLLAVAKVRQDPASLFLQSLPFLSAYPFFVHRLLHLFGQMLDNFAQLKPCVLSQIQLIQDQRLFLDEINQVIDANGQRALLTSLLWASFKMHDPFFTLSLYQLQIPALRPLLLQTLLSRHLPPSLLALADVPRLRSFDPISSKGLAQLYNFISLKVKGGKTPFFKDTYIQQQFCRVCKMCGISAPSLQQQDKLMPNTHYSQTIAHITPKDRQKMRAYCFLLQQALCNPAIRQALLPDTLQEIAASVNLPWLLDHVSNLGSLQSIIFTDRIFRALKKCARFDPQPKVAQKLIKENFEDLEVAILREFTGDQAQKMAAAQQFVKGVRWQGQVGCLWSTELKRPIKREQLLVKEGIPFFNSLLKKYLTFSQFFRRMEQLWAEGGWAHEGEGSGV